MECKKYRKLRRNGGRAGARDREEGDIYFGNQTHMHIKRCYMVTEFSATGEREKEIKSTSTRDEFAKTETRHLYIARNKIIPRRRCNACFDATTPGHRNLFPA